LGGHLTLYRKSGKTGELTVDLDELFSQTEGFTITTASVTDHTVYVGPNSSGVPSGKVFHIENITLTHYGGAGAAALVRFYRAAAAASQRYAVIVGLSETFYMDQIKGLMLLSGYFLYIQAFGAASISCHVGGRLRPRDTHSA
jgi:hypothetical protein